MFSRKNKKRDPQGPGGPEAASFAPPPVEAEQTELSRKTELVRQGQELLGVVEARYGDFLDAARQRGMSTPDIRAALVDGWNAGALPRTIPGETYRGSGDELHILHGQVPAGFFDALGEDGSSIDLDGEFKGVRAYEIPRGVPREATTGEPEEFYVETVMLAQHADERLDEAQQKSAMEHIADSFPKPSE